MWLSVKRLAAPIEKQKIRKWAGSGVRCCHYRMAAATDMSHDELGLAVPGIQHHASFWKNRQSRWMNETRPKKMVTKVANKGEIVSTTNLPPSSAVHFEKWRSVSPSNLIRLASQQVRITAAGVCCPLNHWEGAILKRLNWPSPWCMDDAIGDSTDEIMQQTGPNLLIKN